MKKVYISGPISGIERADYLERFTEAERMLREYGYDVVNPTRFLLCRWQWLYKIVGYKLTLLYDLWRLMHCDFIYKMPTWKQSKGANIESCVAYNTEVFLIKKKYIETIDGKIEKIIKRQEACLKKSTQTTNG